MNHLLKKVGPLTSGLIWITQKLSDTKNPMYENLDYLSDGLLTQTLNNNKEPNSITLISKNFHENFYIFIFNEFEENKFQSYLDLFSNDLNGEKSILVIDEKDFFNEILKKTPKDLRSHLHLY